MGLSKIESSYTIVTNIYNEAGNIKGVIESIAKQTKQPKHWLWVDDGSNDGGKGREEIMRYGIESDLSVSIITLPPKDAGSLDTIGLAWNKALPYLKANYAADYLAIVDVDNRFPEAYFEDMIQYLQDNSTVGTVAGQARGERKRKRNRPMGGGKVIKWVVIDSIDAFWKLAPDTFVNIKANALGYDTVARDVLVDQISPSRGWSSKGMRRFGGNRHYAGNTIFVVGFLTIKHIWLRLHGFQLLRGFLKARFWDRVEQCKDPDVRYHYSKRYALKQLYGRVRN